MRISFSIVTPVFNRSDTIKRCIDSVLKQDFVDFEHIIIDDGSTDASFDIANSYAKIDERIKVFRFDINKGTNAGRNFTIKKASKAFVIILDSDDFLTENALQIITNTIKNNSSYKHYLFAADDMMPSYNANELLKKQTNILHYKQWLERAVTGDFIHVVERELMQSFPFNEYIRIFEGTNFLRIYRQGEKQLFIKEIITIRERGRDDSVTLTGMLTNKGAIEKSYLSLLHRLEWFAGDMVTNNLKGLLLKDSHVIIKLGLALSDYKKVKDFCLQLNIKMNLLEKTIYNLRLGKLLQWSIIIYYKYLKI